MGMKSDIQNGWSRNQAAAQGMSYTKRPILKIINVLCGITSSIIQDDLEIHHRSS